MRTLNSVRTLAMGGAVLLALGLPLATAPQAQGQELRGWNIHVVDYPVSHGMEQFIAEVADKTDGRITGEVFHGGVLGSQPDAIEQLRLGAIDFAVFSLGPMGQVVPETNVRLAALHLQGHRPDVLPDGRRRRRCHRRGHAGQGHRGRWAGTMPVRVPSTTRSARSTHPTMSRA